MMMIIITAFV